MPPLAVGLILLGCSAGLTWDYWQGIRSGVAILGVGLNANRESSPTVFWLFQALIGVPAATMALLGLGLIFGLLPA